MPAEDVAEKTHMIVQVEAAEMAKDLADVGHA